MNITMFTIWIILFVFMLDLCLSLISASNTIENILGFYGVVITIVVSYKTKCLTIFKIKTKKHEK
jgi:succinate-acetate transporter protein